MDSGSTNILRRRELSFDHQLLVFSTIFINFSLDDLVHSLSFILKEQFPKELKSSLINNWQCTYPNSYCSRAFASMQWVERTLAWSRNCHLK
jgi:hypothetical protein